MNKTSKGRIAEELAKEYLVKMGYKILKTNYRTKESEIDLICISPNNALCFVEVRSGRVFSPAESINLKKMKKIIKGALSFLSEINWNGDVRFDVVVIYGDYSNPKFEHIVSAFEEI